MKVIIEDKKLFEKPELEIIEFTNDDIITDSGDLDDPNPKQGDINGWW